MKVSLQPLTMPRHLRQTVEAAFDIAFNNSINDIRRLLLGAVHTVVEEQVSLALASYGDQLAGCEGAVMQARRNIIEDNASINAECAKLKNLWSENSRDNARLQEGLARVVDERNQLREDRLAVDAQKKTLEYDRSRLKTEEAKLRAGLSDLRSQKQQVMQWHGLLSKMEQGMMTRSNDMGTLPPGSVSWAELQETVRQIEQTHDEVQSSRICSLLSPRLDAGESAIGATYASVLSPRMDIGEAATAPTWTGSVAPGSKAAAQLSAGVQAPTPIMPPLRIGAQAGQAPAPIMFGHQFGAPPQTPISAKSGSASPTASTAILMSTRTPNLSPRMSPRPFDANRGRSRSFSPRRSEPFGVLPRSF
jgi:hypothetical protein